MIQIIFTVIRREIILAIRRRSEVLTTLFFFIIVVSLFPLSVGPEITLLTRIGPGILWVAALLATMLSLGRLFAADYQDGTLEQFMLIPQPLAVIVFSKVVAHWLISGLPLVLLSPILALQLGLGTDLQAILLLSLIIGTPTLSLIGAVGAALTLGLRSGGILLSLLILPLYIPVLIFGAGAVEATAAGLQAGGHLALMAALLVMSLVFAPWATAAAIRISLD